MTVTHVGTSKRYAAGWEAVFGTGVRRAAPRAASAKKKVTPGTAAGKRSTKKRKR